MRRLVACGFLVVLLGTLTLALWSCAADPPLPPPWSNAKPGAELSPLALAATPDGQTLYVACATAWKILTLDITHHTVTHALSLPGPANAVALNADASRLLVACGLPVDGLIITDPVAGKVCQTIPTGAGACAVALHPKNGLAYVASQFTNDVAIVDTARAQVVGRIPVTREPVALAFSPDGQTLLVANHLPAGAADVDVVAAVVSVIDATANQVVATITLPNGSTGLKGVAVSPDGKLACVTHILARYTVPTTQLERGWMNTNALSLIDVPGRKLLNTVLLDDVDSGAANPWAVAFEPDGQTLAITHAGTQEVSLLNVPGMLAKLAKATPAEVPNDLGFLVDLRQRLKLRGNGPRSLAVVGDKLFVGEYFTDSLSVIGLKDKSVATIPLAPTRPLTPERQGEMFFHDASLCFQGWQSCSTCHPGNARVDGLNWDLLNDGIGNPKNTRSLLLAHKREPVMALGERDTVRTAVRSGIRFIQFAVRPESDAAAIEAYIRSLQPVPSPYLVRGYPSAAAGRGQKIFEDPNVGCAECHRGDLHTNLQNMDVGTRRDFDKPTDRFIVPTLVELWRTAPYLHDGSAATLRDVLTTRNKDDRHGHTSQLTKQQLDDLVEYLQVL